MVAASEPVTLNSATGPQSGSLCDVLDGSDSAAVSRQSPNDHRALNMAKTEEPVTIKKYANRRLYNTGTSTYVTLEDLATMVKNGRGFRGVRRQDRRGHHALGADPDHLRAGEQGRGRTCCRSPSCASSSASTATACRCWCRAISKSRSTRSPASRRSSASSWPGLRRDAVRPLLEEQVRRNMEMFERAFSMFTPFARREAGRGSGGGEAERRRPGFDSRPISTSSSVRLDEHAPQGREA